MSSHLQLLLDFSLLIDDKARVFLRFAIIGECEPHSQIAAIERRREKQRKEKKQLSILQFFLLLRLVAANKRAEKIAHNLLCTAVRRLSIDDRSPADGSSERFFQGNSSSQTCTHASPGKQRLLLLKLYFFSPKQKKNFFTLTISITHRNSILIFIFCSVFCCHWN